MSKFGWYKWSKVLQKVVPIDEARSADAVLANVAHGFIGDEMEAVKHPLDKKYYTSKAKFRAVTKAHGYEEVGTAYENGYDPEIERERESEKQLRETLHDKFRAIVNSGVNSDIIREYRERSRGRTH